MKKNKKGNDIPPLELEGDENADWIKRVHKGKAKRTAKKILSQKREAKKKL